ncbi:MAG: calcium-binding protein [Geitlerinemataceae cyanobacterium]
MTSDTKFLQPINPTSNPNPNSVSNSTELLTYNYSQNPSSVSVQIVADVLVKGGLARAIAEFQATAGVDPAFSEILSETIVELEGGVSEGQSQIKSKVVGVFEVEAQQTFSFGFSSSLELKAKEIDNPDIEYSKAKSEGAFLVLDLSNLNRPKIVDYFAFDSQLISSKKIGNVRAKVSRNFTIVDRDRNIDIDGNNGIDFVTGAAIGTYQNQFRNNTQIAVVEVNASNVQAFGDYLIDNLGTDVTYGTIWNDNLNGTSNADKIYASLGNDRVSGMRGDDIIEGGGGNDRLEGGDGNDKIHGGDDNDLITDGLGDDVMYGGEGADRFVFKKNQSLRPGEFNIVADFRVGVDRVTLRGWGKGKIADLFTDTPDGAIFTAKKGGQVLFEDVDKGAIISSFDLA